MFHRILAIFILFAYGCGLNDAVEFSRDDTITQPEAVEATPESAEACTVAVEPVHVVLNFGVCDYIRSEQRTVCARSFPTDYYEALILRIKIIAAETDPEAKTALLLEIQDTLEYLLAMERQWNVSLRQVE